MFNGKSLNTSLILPSLASSFNFGSAASQLGSCDLNLWIKDSWVPAAAPQNGHSKSENYMTMTFASSGPREGSSSTLTSCF